MKNKIVVTHFIIMTFLLTAGFQSHTTHTVKKNETLYSIARYYRVSVDDLVSCNNFRDSTIYEGQIIKIPQQDEHEYVVEKNDNLEKISGKTGIPVKTIKSINHLESDLIIPGMVLKLPRTASINEIYTVEEKDTLSHIASLYGITVDDIKKTNNLQSSNIYPGQKIIIPCSSTHTNLASAGNSGSSYIVGKGDTLWSISRKFNISVNELTVSNNLNSETLYPGQKLVIKSSSVPSEIQSTGKNQLLSYYSLLPQSDRINHLSGDYYNFAPKGSSQPSEYYYEEKYRLKNYQMAVDILEEFDKSIESMERQSNVLAGYYIVLDPGHGGDDPGFLVKSINSRGEAVYLVEDEYNYDIALRVYRLLTLNGAEVGLTVISPNHTIRSTKDPSITFINEKNEVYNSYEFNKRNQCSDFPDGNVSSLQKRKQVAGELFKGTPQDKRLFICLHNDISPGLPKGAYVIFDGSETKELSNSEEFAEKLLPSLGDGSFANHQSIAVLKNNPADAAILIEVRNVYYENNSWALRNEELRERDALKIVAGVIEYVKSR